LPSIIWPWMRPLNMPLEAPPECAPSCVLLNTPLPAYPWIRPLATSPWKASILAYSSGVEAAESALSFSCQHQILPILQRETQGNLAWFPHASIQSSQTSVKSCPFWRGRSSGIFPEFLTQRQFLPFLQGKMLRDPATVPHAWNPPQQKRQQILLYLTRRQTSDFGVRYRSVVCRVTPRQFCSFPMLGKSRKKIFLPVLLRLTQLLGQELLAG